MCSLLSLVYTLLSVSVLLLGVVVVYFSLGGKLPAPLRDKVSVMQQESKNEILSDKNLLSNSPNNKVVMEQRPIKGEQIPVRVILGGVICLIIICIMLFLFFFLKLTNRFSYYVEVLEEGIEEITRGNFSYQIDIPSQDEFGIIAEKMNQMSKAIEKIIDENQRGEDRKHELITSVAHDLRTPLTSVIGYLELLRSDKVNQETKEHYTEIVYQKAKRLEQLIEDLFSYTKYTYGNVAAITQPVDVVKLLEQLLDEFYPSFEENNLTVNFYKDCSSMVSYADGNLLARALANLISNAIKYGVDGKKVEIFFVHRSSEMQITVKNYGNIIPEQDMPHIFERFYRVEDSRSQETGGSGLGLAIAQSIVNMHHGSITAKSSLSGTIFEVRLPIIREPERS